LNHSRSTTSLLEPPRDDLDLLRAYEPVVRFTKGELFFPTAVGPYVKQCSLWAAIDRAASCIVPAGELSVERLRAEALARPDQPLSLRFVAAPLTRGELRRWRRQPREKLVAAGRFTTTGMFGRLIEAAFRASLLLRGTVAAGLAAAAEVTYRERLDAEHFTYYGRAVRTGGYICLQYWYFYAMNDWRSTFGGVNDHEADWELATVYLAEREGQPPVPAWVAFSSHDHHGDALRRRWDDPQLLRHGEHPVLFPGAGSHSGAFVAGDYVISVDPPQLRKTLDLARRLQRLLAPWRDATRTASGLGIPFVDYARGDGRIVGPGQPAQWEANLIDDETPWVRDYRGLWGLDTKDYFGGERAPSGPRYERDGSIRHAWADPLGWAGLLKVPPAEEMGELLSRSISALEDRLRRLEVTIETGRDELRTRAIELRSLEAHDYARALADQRRTEMAEVERRLEGAILERANAADELRTHRDTLSRPVPAPGPQAHLGEHQGPRSIEQERRQRFLRLWAAISTPLLLGLVPVILLAQPLAWITTLIALAVLFLGVEAFARGRFLSFLASTLLLIAIVVVVVVFVELFRRHWQLAVSAVFGAAALVLLIGNVGDVSYGWRRGGRVSDDESE
jgi:hypothetical protein